MNTADTVMVGPLGAVPLAATGVGSAIHFFGIVFSTGIIIGMTPLVSQAYGAGDLPRCRRVLVQGLWAALILSVPTIWVNAAGGEIARGLGQDPAVSELAGDYLLSLTWGIPPFLLFMALRQYLEGMGRVRAPMVVTFFGLAINIVANRVLIYGWADRVPALGMVGSGWATTIVRFAMLIALLAYVLTRRGVLPFRGVRLRPERPLLGRIFKIGTPTGAHFGLEVGLFSFAAVMMGWLGAVEVAAHQVTINIASTTFMVALGISNAGTIRVGQSIGARRPRAVRRAAIGTYLLATGFMALCALVFLLLPRELITLYTREDPVIDIGARLLLMAAAFQIFDGAQVAGGSVLRGAADTRAPMVIAAVGYWVIGVPIGYWLAFRAGLGPIGVWAGLTVGLGVAAVLLVLRVRRFMRTEW